MLISVAEGKCDVQTINRLLTVKPGNSISRRKKSRTKHPGIIAESACIISSHWRVPPIDLHSSTDHQETQINKTKEFIKLHELYRKNICFSHTNYAAISRTATNISYKPPCFYTFIHIFTIFTQK